jgi:LysM repeat protein
MMIINSFNEWAEGSHIEPSIEFGNAYLDMTSQLSSGYKSGNIAVPAPVVQVTSTQGPTVTPSVTATFGPSPTPTETSTPTSTATPTSVPTPIASPTPRADGAIVYEAVAGDSFFGISERFDVDLATIYELNNLSDASILTIGQSLILGYSQGAQGLTLPEFPGAVILEDGTAIYTVKEGDTPIGIAVKYGLDLPELYDLNDGFTSESILQIGQRLIVGHRPIPEEVGGSSDMPTLTASPTHTATPSKTPVPESSPSPTEAPVTTTAVTNSDLQTSTEIADDQPTRSLGLLPFFLGGAFLLAVAGGIFLYLGRQAE